MSDDPNARERELVARHIVRSRTGPRQHNDGYPETDTPEYDRLPRSEQRRIREIRAGIRSDETLPAFRLAGPDRRGGSPYG
jgi:hypothetical protein